MPMELGLANEQGYPHRGHVDYQEPAADPGTGTDPDARDLSQS